MKLTIAQYQIQYGQPSQNLAAIHSFAGKAHEDQSNLLMLPELCLHGYHSDSIKLDFLSHLPALLPVLGDICREYSLDICGSFVEEEDGSRYNTMIYLDQQGRLLAKYRKTHLFKPLHEHRCFNPGDTVTVVDTAFGKLGLAICYDLRFPELFRAMLARGATGFLICAEWPVERIEHWQTILRARAIENLAWIGACNCTGISGKATFGGSSLFFSPWGDTLAQLEGETCQTIEFDPAITDQVRQENPFLDDWRPF
jgi:predicted amidohydrolase